METKRHYHSHLGRIDGGPSPLTDVTVAEMFVFLAITELIGHYIRDKTIGQIINQFNALCYSSAMKRYRYLHILRLLHFTDNNNEPDMPEENSNKLRKI